MNELRVVIADDSETIRGLLEQTLSSISGLKIVGFAENGAAALSMIDALSPDLLVLDLEMPKKNGIEVLRDLRQRVKPPLIVMFTANPSTLIRDACLQAGADHYLDKSQIDGLINICKEVLLAS